MSELPARPMFGGPGIGVYANIELLVPEAKRSAWLRAYNKRLAELAELMDRYTEAQQRVGELRRKVEESSQTYTSARGRFLRGLLDSEPEDPANARAELEAAESDLAALEAAALSVEHEVAGHVAAGGADSILATLRESGRRRAGRIGELYSELDALQREQDKNAAVHEWLRSGAADRFTLQPPVGTPAEWYAEQAPIPDPAAPRGVITSHTVDGLAPVGYR